jgi:phage tail-like protein
MNNENITTNYFTVEIDGIQTDQFFSCEGLELESNVYEFEEGGFNISTHKQIWQSRSPNIILKKGINKNNELIDWYKNNTNDKVEKKTISIVLMNSSQEEIRRWNIYRAFPVRWKCSPLNASDNAFLVETIEIAHD